MAFGPLWSQFLLLFKVCAHTHKRKHARTLFRKFSATTCPALLYFQNLLKTILLSFGPYYIYLSYITSKILVVAKGVFSSPKSSSMNLEPINPSYSTNTEFQPQQYGGRSVNLATHFLLVPMLRMSGATPLCPLYDSIVWTATDSRNIKLLPFRWFVVTDLSTMLLM